MKKGFTKTNLKTFAAVLRYLKIFRIHFLLSLIFTAISVALSLYVPILVGDAIDLAIGTGLVSMRGIEAILLKILAAVLITGILQWLINVLNNRMTFGMVRNIRYEAFKRIQSFPEVNRKMRKLFPSLDRCQRQPRCSHVLKHLRENAEIKR